MPLQPPTSATLSAPARAGAADGTGEGPHGAAGPATPGRAPAAGEPGPAQHAGHYRVLVARDARFDGRLFVGVSSTGIYCRPICRVRTPLARNCHFFETAAQAEAAAYRPCLKCRPELAPGPGGAWTVMDASRTLARQAAALLDGPAADGDGGGVAALAQRLGVSERHLRRIFLAEHGVGPLQYLQTRRLLLAKQLLTDTALPVTQVALASGWRSLRRFNAAFVASYRMSPSRLRAAQPGAARPSPSAPGAPSQGNAEPAPGEAVALQLAYRPPLDHARLLAFFGQRAIPGIEAVDGQGLVRSLRPGALAAAGAPSAAGWVEVRFDPTAARLRLRFAPTLLPHSGALVAAVRRWFDLDAQPAVIDAALAGLPGAPGLRLPGAVDAFELAVRAVLGQQVTVAGARTLASRLVARHGAPLATPWPAVQRCFPTPEVLARLAPEVIAAHGIIRSRAAAIVALAAAWDGLACLLLPGSDPQRLIERLCALPGIGPWTAHYIAMRALGWPDAFPPGDVAVLKALRLQAQAAASLATTVNAPPAGHEAPMQGAAQRTSAATLRAATREAECSAEAWRPWRSYAVLKLWDSLAPAAAVAPIAPVAPSARTTALSPTAPPAGTEATTPMAPITSATPTTPTPTARTA